MGGEGRGGEHERTAHLSSFAHLISSSFTNGRAERCNASCCDSLKHARTPSTFIMQRYTPHKRDQIIDSDAEITDQ